MNPHVTRLGAFATEERNNYHENNNNLFAFALSQVSRYEEFVRIIFARHRDIAADWVSTTTASFERMKRNTGTRALTKDEIDEMELQSSLTTRLHLEVEAFYLFAKILLDNAARFIEQYFGPGRALSLDSHDDLARCIARYVDLKGITLPLNFIANVERLKQRIADFRDYQIAHAKNPRTVRATVWGADRQPRMAMTQLYPRGSELHAEQKESESLDTLMQSIELHLDELIEIIVKNRAKSRYLRAPSASS